MTKAQEKKELRARIRALAQSLPEDYRAACDQAVAAHLLAMSDYRECTTLFCFAGAGWEIDTRPVLLDALAAGKRLCLPLCTGAPGIMELRAVTSLDDLVPGHYGILEPRSQHPLAPPDEVDFAVLPCLSCDRRGRRLGQGGGYYDRFLSAYRGSAVLLCRERLLQDEIPMEPHDYPVPWVLTERGLYEDGIPARLG